MWLKLLPLILLMACSSTKNTEMTKNAEAPPQLHDIWALQSINGEKAPKGLTKQPVLEIFVSDKKIVGNDGCNNIAGPIKILNATEIRFGNLMGTKMACPNMPFSRSFNENITRTHLYLLKGMTLVLQDENGKELMTFKKVD